MSGRHMLFSLLCSLCLVSGGLPAWAYENVDTHPLISERGVDLLKDTGEYQELQRYRPQISRGSFDEDVAEFFTVVRKHFYYVPTGHGLFWYKKSPLGVDEQTNRNQDALTRARIHWEDAVRKYRTNNPSDRAAAFGLVGQMLHLATQDMAQPAHTHNDWHVPHGLWTAVAARFGLVPGIDPSPLEKFVEGRVPSRVEILPRRLLAAC